MSRPANSADSSSTGRSRLTREQVVDAYLGILSREPEDEAAIEFQQQHDDLRHLCIEMVRSREFSSQVAERVALATLRNPAGLLGALGRWATGSAKLAPAAIDAAYAGLLRREPTEEELRRMATLPSFVRLCDSIVLSDEFAARFGLGDKPRTIEMTDLDDLAVAFHAGDRTTYAGSNLRLPDWYDLHLDPMSEPYRAQVIRLWREISGIEAYDADINEDTPEIAGIDVIRNAPQFASGDTKTIGGHIMAAGHVLMRSGLSPGAVALEYGAGLGQIALNMARSGVTVHTVDINPHFTDAVRRLAEHYAVPIFSHVGKFGDNPLGDDSRYDLIYFYESFHHCLEHQTVIPKLRSMLKPGGRILLAGEPIFNGYGAAMPYPWGIRLDWENVAVVRARGWMELGFEISYLAARFAEAGFDYTLYSDPNSNWAQVYEFTLRE